MKNYDICVLGGCSLDQMFYQNVDGSYNDFPSIKVPGGKGANQAVAAARAGAKVTIISKVGKDEIGKTIVNNLSRNMVDVSNIEMIEGLINDTSSIYIHLKSKDNDIRRTNGAIDSFTEDMIEKYADVILNSKIVVAQMKAPKEVSKKLINFCYENNKPLIITPCRPEKLNINEPGNKELIDKISFITANENECKIVFQTENIEECVAKYPNKLIVTLGEKGVIYHDGEKTVKIDAIKVDKILDTTGAGDTFNGNLSCALAKGETLDEAIRKAIYASTMKLRSKSAQDGMPYKEELEEFMESYISQDFAYEEELKHALKIIKQAYEMVRAYSNLNVKFKEDKSVVTDVDIKIEEFLISEIERKFKGDYFVTEERNPKQILENRTWIIDPIDGTAHFIKNSIFWGIQMAFFDKNETQFSVIYIPKLDELYYAINNKGAYLNNKRIYRKEEVPINKAIVEFGGSLHKYTREKRILLEKLLDNTNGKSKVLNIMHINSSCISFTNLAAGRTDVLIMSSKNLWDVMPGKLLCKEMGIKMTYLDFNRQLELYSCSKETSLLLLPEEKREI